MRDCPKCGDPIADRQDACSGCGWTKPGRKAAAAAFDPLHFLCSHEDRGERCAKPGTLSSSTLGGGPWFCAEHFPPFKAAAAPRYHQAPAGFFRSVRTLLPRKPDLEADAEREAIQAEP